MRDDESRTALHRRFQPLLDEGFRLGVERAGGFVEQQQRRVFEHRAGDGDALALATGETHTSLTEKGAVTIRQTRDEFIGQCSARGGDHFRIAGSGAAIANIFHRVAGENHRVLRDDGAHAAQIVERQLANVDAVERDASAAAVVKAQQQLEHRGLAGAGWADQRDGLAAGDVEREAIECRHLRARGVAETDVGKLQRCAVAHRQRFRLRRWFDVRLGGEQLHQTLGCATRAHHVAPHLGEHADRACHEAGVEHERRKLARRHRAGNHIARAEPEYEHDRAEGGGDNDRGQCRAHAGAANRRGETVFHPRVKPPGFA